MKIRYAPNFIQTLDRQVEYISKDKPSASRRFKNELLRECKSLTDNPYRSRKSIYYDDDSIRDLVFKGYTIIYEISDETISIFAITKYKEYEPKNDKGR